jgi:hypothetical protein
MFWDSLTTAGFVVTLLTIAGTIFVSSRREYGTTVEGKGAS